MEEKTKFKRQLFKNILYNEIVVMIILLLFGTIIFSTIRYITYQSADNLLRSAKKVATTTIDSNIARKNNNLFLDLRDIFFYNQYEDLEDKNYSDVIQNIEEDLYLVKKIVNPNIVVVIRDNKGKIIGGDLGRLEYFENEVKFDSKKLDDIYEIAVNGEYFYRGINFIIDDEDMENVKYIQLLTNIDTERMLLKNYMKVIMQAIVIGTILSCIASIKIANKTLKPLKDNLNKQLEFVQNVSHELRTPLTIIQAKQEMLLTEPDKKIIDKSEDIVSVLNETKRLSKLVKDLLVLTRSDSKEQLHKESVNIDDYIKEIVNPFIEIAELENKKLSLDLSYKIDISIDLNKFYQLMVILLDNALKYTEEGDTITIKTYLKDNKCNIEVQDTGIGINDDNLKRVFERFYREDEARNRETGGTGLGLSIASMIVNYHDGSIKAVHNNPKGTIFIIKLPK